MTVRRATVRLYGDLGSFFADADRAGEVQVPIGEPRSVKDVVESVGVPHPEVDLLLVDGVSVGFDHLICGGERIAVYPPFVALPVGAASQVRPPRPPPRFALDVHLGALARRLRALGFDSTWRRDADDAALAAAVAGGRRVLLTRDRGLLMRRVVVHGYCPRSDSPDVQALEVVRRYRLHTELAPLTRCLRCNGLLRPVAKGDVIDKLPPRTRVEHSSFARCDACGQIYWPGSHTPALLEFVDRVRAAAG